MTDRTKSHDGTMKRRVTLRDVAQAAGVHLSTVSRALNPDTAHLITPAVVEEIRQASRALNYRPNAAAYSLRTNRTSTIGVVVPDITNPVFPPIIRGIEDALAGRGYLAILANTDGGREREAEVAETLRARGVEGLILASVEREDAAVSRIASEGLPVVTVNRRIDDAAVSSVVNDEEDGIRRLLDHLTGLGHRRIANIAGPQSLSTGAGRYRAFEAYRGRFGLDPNSALVVFAAGFNEQEGEAGVEELLRRGIGFTAIVCSNDRLAIGAIAALRRNGRECPSDVSVTGYNDMPLVDRLSPALTTIRIHQYDVGRAAGGMLLEMIATRPDLRRPRQIVHPVDLVVRTSTAPCG